MRRQKCDRKDPCTRCIQNNEAGSCSRKWQDGYDPRLHRTYPKRKAMQPSENTIPSGLTSDGVPQTVGQDSPLILNKAPTEGTYSLQATVTDFTNVTVSQSLSGIAFASDMRQGAPNGFQPASAAYEPTSTVFPENEYEGSSALVPSTISSSTARRVSADNSANTTSYSYAGLGSRDIEKQHLQRLVPTSLQVSRLVDYHEQCLIWYHGCVHGPTFRMELNKALQGSDNLQLNSVDLRWSALLFSIMAASLTCASDSVAHSWGFPKAQKRYLCKQWYEASVVCLDLGDYTSKPNVYSIQAIQVLSMSAHTIGFSDKQFVIFGAAIRIAQNLGLQRLAQDPDLDSIPTDSAGTSPSRKDLLTRREVGRRIWTQMCTQDWFSIPSSDMYSINKRHFTTSRPRRIDDENMILAGDQTPVATDSTNLLYEIASLMADFHDSITTLSDAEEKYDQVLKYDSRMRALGTQPTPHIIFTETTQASGPQWVRWAKGVASIVQAHKTIMIHRSFLGKSFTDARYTYTRWASITASKTIIREADVTTTDVERPAFWHVQVSSKYGNLRNCSQVGVVPLDLADDFHRPILLVQVLPFVSIYSVVRGPSQNSQSTRGWLIRLSLFSRGMTIAH